MGEKDEPWSPAEATRRIRAMARSSTFSVAYKVHAQQRLVERGLLVSDVLFVLKHGFVHKDAVRATRPDFFRYELECRTPNSEGRTIGVIGIPDAKNNILKIVTVMWVDETDTRAGTFTEE